MPTPEDDGRGAGPLGREVSEPPDDGSTGSADGVAGPSYPPEETEPDKY